MLLLLAGTGEGREIVEFLEKKGIPYLATVTSDYGKSLMTVHTEKIKFDPEGLKDIIYEKKISGIVDATHPFARVIKNIARKAARECGIKYIRFERGRLKRHKGVKYVKDYTKAIKYLENSGLKAFLTIGSNHLDKFIDKNFAIVARVLPTLEVMKKVMALRLTPDQIIAMKGPFTRELNRAMIEQTGCKILVTKESGERGGEKEKYLACNDLGIEMVTIERPVFKTNIIVYNLEGLDRVLRREGIGYDE
ncbi:MAG: precorrin-6A reductase [Deltaproteobacteria bacterium]|nr:MAG: precorrin-6A reductase [Deltaproteobacteria bacterium]